jgi:FKBP-type peptidyl-prolyl cis-trans isomerase
MSIVVSEGVKKDVLKQGAGPIVHKGDEITVHCTGSQVDTGSKFWSTKDPGQQPFKFKVGQGQVIPGWDEGCQTMSEGEISKLTLSPNKAYGNQGFPAWGIKPNATLTFEIEVISVNGK